jgi:hypothetical protein
MSQLLGDIVTKLTWALVGAVGLILLGLAGLTLFNPLILKLGLRNVPRRRSQAALIVLGLTLSTIIITSSLTTGDTLQYSVRRHAIDAYGEIDEVLAPPLLANLLSLTNNQDNTTSDGGADALAGLLGGQDIFSLLDTGLPGIPVARYEELRRGAADEPLLDKLAPAIVFPTIVRDVSTGQGEPMGFIFAVDDEYDTQFGLRTVQGQPAPMAVLRPGASNIFQLASDLVAGAMKTAAEGAWGTSNSLTLREPWPVVLAASRSDNPPTAPFLKPLPASRPPLPPPRPTQRSQAPRP